MKEMYESQIAEAKQLADDCMTRGDRQSAAYARETWKELIREYQQYLASEKK